MKNNLNWSLLLPTALTIFQAVLYLVLAVLLLRQTKLIKSPVVEMKNSAALTTGIILFGVLLISTSSIESLYKSFVFQSGVQVYTFENIFTRFGQLFFVTVCAQSIFLLFSWYVSNMFIEGGNVLKEAQAGNIPVSILFSFIALGIAICCFFISKNICDMLIPVMLDFR